jgi:hypothetical protein
MPEVRLWGQGAKKKFLISQVSPAHSRWSANTLGMLLFNLRGVDMSIEK